MRLARGTLSALAAVALARRAAAARSKRSASSTGWWAAGSQPPLPSGTPFSTITFFAVIAVNFPDRWSSV